MKDGEELFTLNGQSQAEVQQQMESQMESRAAGKLASNNKKWKKRFNDLKEFKDVHDHFIVPTTKGEKLRKLSIWMRRQREYRSKSSLSEDRIQMLDGIGFPWKVNKTWEENYEELVEFWKKNHHSKVPSKTESYSSLYSWSKTQRRRYHKSSITPEQRDMLDDIGFDWGIPKKRKNKEKIDYDSESEDEALVESESEDEALVESESEDEALVESESEDEVLVGGGV